MFLSEFLSMHLPKAQLCLTVCERVIEGIRNINSYNPLFAMFRYYIIKQKCEMLFIFICGIQLHVDLPSKQRNCHLCESMIKL